MKISVTESTINGPDTILPYLLSLTLLSPPARKSPGLRYHDYALEKTGPFKTLYYWKELDFAYPSKDLRENAILYEDFIPKHNLPLGEKICILALALLGLRMMRYQ